MARQFAAQGRDLALCARRVDALEALRAQLLAAHPSVTVAVRALDVNDHAAVRRSSANWTTSSAGSTGSWSTRVSARAR